MLPRRISIIGIGLIGGSLGLAIKKFIPKVFITGADLKSSSLKEALARKAIDRGTTSLSEGVRNAELVFLATPVNITLEILKKLPHLVAPSATITDLGSTKVEICQTGKKFLHDRFIGGHPMTGSEIQGIKGADPFLFENALYILTPTNSTDLNAKNLANFLRRIGALVHFTSPKLHDEIAAYVSHLPQLLAVALAFLIYKKSMKEALYRDLAAGGFRDMTRIASSPYPVWHDIFQTNDRLIQEGLDNYIDLLVQFKKQLTKKSLGNLFNRASVFRNHLPIQRKGFMKPLYRITVRAEDQPGVLAEITGTLAKKQINIRDIELLKVREGFSGTFQLYFTTLEDAKKAASTLSQISYETRQVD